MLKDFWKVIGRMLIFIPIFLTMIFCTFPFQTTSDFAFSPNGDSATRNNWVDSVFRLLSPDERIGQLFMVEASSKWGGNDKFYTNLLTYVDSCHVGGVIFFYGGPVREAALINELQARTKVPLMVAQDGEWGLAMRLDSVPCFPRNLCLGAIANNELIYDLGEEIGQECRRLGVNIDFMPCVDIYDNISNTVIANRSFGSSPHNVALKGSAIMSGMQKNGILTTAKHFPGHGNTATDSHEALPVINVDYQRIDTFELYPFRYLFANGIKGVMVGHLFIPALEADSSHTPSSVSSHVINDLLINKLEFKGLVFTDALQMKGVSKQYSPGELEVKAFEAGVDVFLMPGDCRKAYSAMVQARDEGKISQAEIDRRCRKILHAKLEMGLHKFKPISTQNLYSDLNNAHATDLNRILYENAVTLVSNNETVLPLHDIENLKIATVSISKSGVNTEFENTFAAYTDNVDRFAIAKTATDSEFAALASRLNGYDVVVVGFHNGSSYPSSFGTTKAMTAFVDKLALSQKVILDVFTSPLCLNKFENYSRCAAVVVSFEDNSVVRKASAKMILGSLPFKGVLPITVNPQLREGLSIHTEGREIEY